MLVTFGSERVKLAENRSLRPRALVSSLPKPCSALMLREGRLAAVVFCSARIRDRRRGRFSRVSPPPFP